MALRNGGRKISFEVLSVEDESDPTERNRKKRRHRASKKKKKLLDRADSDSADPRSAPLENGGACNGFELDASRYCGGGGGGGGSVVVCEEVREAESVCAVAEARGAESEEATAVRGGIEGFNFGELRQRNVNCGSSEDLAASVVVRDEKEDGGVNASPVEKATNEPDRNVVKKLETVESLDWKRIMAEDPNFVFSVEKSPVSYFLEEMHNGNSLRSTTTLGNEKERERVYDTIFRLPWRCELLIDVGFFVCFDSFLSLLTVMPARIMMTIWRLLKTRQFKRLSTMEVSDFGCFLILSSGVVLLQQTDISLIYHMIRGQGTIKLYVVYNVLEIFDKLCQSFNGDVLQTLFLSAEGLANCPPESMRFWIWRFISDQALAVAASIVHSFILLAQAITLSTCIVAHNNALFALLVSNNFAEIKSNVFKRYSKDNVHSLVYFGFAICFIVGLGEERRGILIKACVWYFGSEVWREGK
ncbi:protein POLLEN DEFECTIVE IN GUIDANCE 1 isoform X3 [Glycine max]|uniref:protein POLLEN DEFECTIVE IN GUIDANCE 1 isoform X3 n=1 Tax=Glycine max TaxID=3847 RepID=UPI001B357AAE|nr:protein POLLEN DEFECTIVE IN GUIDANCE 1 isoform X3 [Glycine max]